MKGWLGQYLEIKKVCEAEFLDFYKTNANGDVKHLHDNSFLKLPSFSSDDFDVANLIGRRVNVPTFQKLARAIDKTDSTPPESSPRVVELQNYHEHWKASLQRLVDHQNNLKAQLRKLKDCGLTFTFTTNTGLDASVDEFLARLQDKLLDAAGKGDLLVREVCELVHNVETQQQLVEVTKLANMVANYLARRSLKPTSV